MRTGDISRVCQPEAQGAVLIHPSIKAGAARPAIQPDHDWVRVWAPLTVDEILALWAPLTVDNVRLWAPLTMDKVVEQTLATLLVHLYIACAMQ